LKIAIILALFSTVALAQTNRTPPKTVTFSSYVAENFKILSKNKKEKPQVAFQDTSNWRMPASEEKGDHPKPTVNPNMGMGGFGSNGASGSTWQTPNNPNNDVNGAASAASAAASAATAAPSPAAPATAPSSSGNP
jgi:hypothetical protein